ncbi:MAG: phytanoyl-CoA dioxygenase family protein [Candidatus Poribacteria bacterium]|nr:phytanoyl-CoA dioxygenase family protein [Candidatus Poribacteria bacterium]
MKPEVARETREKMLRDGYCVIPDILSKDFLQELRQESDRLNDTIEHHPDTKYQGTHLGIRYEDNEVMCRLAEWKPARKALEEIRFGDFAHGGGLIILTKEPFAPALYWHQDWMRWEDPLSCTPWPQTIFLSYYLEDTTIESGCLKIIPGTHLKRIPLHDQLITAHEQGARFIEEDHPIMFSDHPDQLDLLTKAGSLVLGDARILHAARKNQTAKRRNLLLLWHNRPETIPDYWDREIPQVIAERNSEAAYSGSRIPGQYLQPEIIN